jgi:hypothetical protein
MAALSEIEKLEARYAENPDGRYFAPLADAYRKAGRVDDALQMVQLGLSKHPDYLSAHIVLGRCYLDKKDDGAARAAFQNTLGLDAENIIALKSLAEIAERQGQTDEARRWLQRLLTVDAMNEDAAADLERLGGPPAEAAVAAASGDPTVPAPAIGLSAQELLAPEPAAPEAPPAAPSPPAPAEPEPVAEQPAAPRPSFTDSPTAPIPVFTMSAPVEPPESPPPPPFAFEPTAMPPLEQAPVPKLHEFQSMAFEAPLEPQAPTPELETTAFEPPAEPVPAAPVEGFTEFDDQLAWGAGDRMSHAIRAEDIEVAEHAHAETAAPIEFVEPPEESAPGEASPFDEPPQERFELPARSTGAIELNMEAMEAPAEEAPVAAHGLPLIMPEDVTPPDELRRPSAKQVQTVSPEPDGASAPGEAGGEAMVTETMGDLYMKQGFRTEAADVYRKVLAQHPDDAAVQAKLSAIESAPSLRASAAGAESVGAWLKRIAMATLGAPAPAPEPPSADEPTPMDQAFEASAEFAVPEVPAAPAAPEASDEESAEGEPEIHGAPARQASEALSLEQIFGGSSAPASTPPPAPAPPGPHALGASFDEFFGTSPADKESVRPKDAPAPRQSEDDLSAFTAWLHGLKR